MIWPGFAGPVQLAYAVDDAAAAARRFAARGIGPFFVREHIEVTDSMVRGEPAPFDHSSAYGQWGDVMVELIVDHGPGEPIGPTGGVHHTAFFVDRIADAQDHLRELGYPEVLGATAGTNRFAMHDATTDLGHLIEVYEPTPRLLEFYAMVRSVAQDWDGTDPVRMIR